MIYLFKETEGETGAEQPAAVPAGLAGPKHQPVFVEQYVPGRQ